MQNKVSKYKIIFEDNSLSDLQKYKKISDLQKKSPKIWTLVIGLNVIIWPFLLTIPNVEIEKPNLNSIVTLKH